MYIYTGRMITLHLLNELYIHILKCINLYSAYLKAGRTKEANRLLKQLSNTAIAEERYLDASYFYWLLAKQCLDVYHAKE